MTLTTETRFNIGDTGYFLNNDHEITKGVIEKIDTRFIVYTNSYTDLRDKFVNVEYTLTVGGLESYECSEDNLYSTPDEILAMFNDQLEKREFDN